MEGMARPRKQRPLFDETRFPQTEVIARHLQKQSRTCGEIVALTGIKQQSATGRIAELMRAGFVRLTGERREGRVVYEWIEGKMYEDFKPRERKVPTKGLIPSSSPAPTESPVFSQQQSMLLQLLQFSKTCEEAKPALKAGGAARMQALEKIEKLIFFVFE